MKNKVFWTNPSYKGHPTAQGEIECDFLVVGGGIMGVSLAYFLQKNSKNKKIVLIEKAVIGAGATGHSAGMLDTEVEGVYLPEFIARHGKANAEAWWKAHEKIHTIIPRIIKELHIDCDYESDRVYYFSHGKKGKDTLKENYRDHVCLGLGTKELPDARSVRKIVSSPYFTYGEKLTSGISVNPLRFVQGFGDALSKKGIDIYEHTPYVRTRGNMAYTPQARIRFKKIIFCLDTFTKEKSLRRNLTTIVVTKPLTKKVLHRIRLEDHDMFMQPFRDSYLYLKVLHDNRLLFGAGDRKRNNYAKTFTPFSPHVAMLSRYVHSIFPGVRIVFDYAWSGIYGIAKHDIPHFEKTDKKVILFGAGTQTASIVMSEFVATVLVRKKHSLSRLFKVRPRK